MPIQWILYYVFLKPFSYAKLKSICILKYLWYLDFNHNLNRIILILEIRLSNVVIQCKIKIFYAKNNTFYNH